MRTILRFAFEFLAIVAVLLLFEFPSIAADLQSFSNVKLINSPANDGDSFLVEANGEKYRVRLYFVDCPETTSSSKSDLRRLREQARYFGLPNEKFVIQFGEEAKEFVESALAKPFTLHTAFASALGRSSKGRIYAFVYTAEGNDLLSALIQNGLARTHGVGRKTPDGIYRDEMIESLRDQEISAMLKRVGIWSKSDPDKIAALRAKERSEDRELEAIQHKVQKSESPKVQFDPNTATESELQSIKGIGPALAKRIVDGRPYKKIDDLLKVKGIGVKKLERFRLRFVLSK